MARFRVVSIKSATLSVGFTKWGHWKFPKLSKVERKDFSNTDRGHSQCMNTEGDSPRTQWEFQHWSRELISRKIQTLLSFEDFDG